jgi:hypothetical protein
MDNPIKMSFEKLIHDMFDPNLEAWKIVQHVVRIDGASIQMDYT